MKMRSLRAITSIITPTLFVLFSCSADSQVGGNPQAKVDPLGHDEPAAATARRLLRKDYCQYISLTNENWMRLLDGEFTFNQKLWSSVKSAEASATYSVPEISKDVFGHELRQAWGEETVEDANINIVFQRGKQQQRIDILIYAKIHSDEGSSDGTLPVVEIQVPFWANLSGAGPKFDTEGYTCAEWLVPLNNVGMFMKENVPEAKP